MWRAWLWVVTYAQLYYCWADGSYRCWTCWCGEVEIDLGVERRGESEGNGGGMGTITGGI